MFENYIFTFEMRCSFNNTHQQEHLSLVTRVLCLRGIAFPHCDHSCIAQRLTHLAKQLQASCKAKQKQDIETNVTSQVASTLVIKTSENQLITRV